MGFHKHGVFSFHVKIERMVVIGGDNFVAEVTALRRHGPSGAAQPLEVPAVLEQYGATASQAEGRVITVMRQWLDAAAERPARTDRSDQEHARQS